MMNALPDDQHRLRCGRCGNLTRFDVVRSMTLREFWHFDMAGNSEIDSTESLNEVISSVTCRWCGATDEVEQVPRPDSE